MRILEGTAVTGMAFVLELAAVGVSLIEADM